MKHLIVTFDFPPSGAGIGTLLAGIAERLDPANTTVLTLPQNDSAAFDAAQPYRIVRRSMTITDHVYRQCFRLRVVPEIAWVLPEAYRTARDLRKVAGDLRPDVIHCGHLLPVALAATMIDPALAPKLVLYAHGAEMASPARFLFGTRLRRRVLERVNLVCASSATTAEAVRGLGIEPERLLKILPPLDLDRYSPGPPDDALLARYGLAGRRLVLAVGRLLPWRGFRGLVKAMPMVLKRHPEAALAIIGDGPDSGRLANRIAAYQLDDSVQLIGAQPADAMPAWYRSAEMVALPGTPSPCGAFEGLGLSVIEAAACGRPAVAGRHGGPAEAVRDGETGLLCDSENADDIARAIVALLEVDDLRHAMGHEARRHVEALYSQGDSVEDLRRRLEGKTTQSTG